MQNDEPDCDVAVVGAGGAGLAAACAAAEQGARVVVIEKLARLEGTTSWSVGSIAAAGTRLQREAGVFDTPEAFAEDMVLAHPQSQDSYRFSIARSVRFNLRSHTLLKCHRRNPPILDRRIGHTLVSLPAKPGAYLTELQIT